MDNKTNQIFIDDHILMKVAYPTPEEHSHYALHLLVAVKNNLKCRINGDIVEGKAIIIASNVKHTAVADNLFMFLFDEASKDSNYFKDRYLLNQNYYVFEDDIALKLQACFGDSLIESDKNVRHLLNLSSKDMNEIDPRISEGIMYLNGCETISKDIIDILSKNACLSKSRYCHLFKEEIGVSLNSYLVMAKMRLAYLLYLNGNSITDACITAGFDSSSHFSSTCRKMFGLSFSSFAKSMI